MAIKMQVLGLFLLLSRLTEPTTTKTTLRTSHFLLGRRELPSNSPNPASRNEFTGNSTDVEKKVGILIYILKMDFMDNLFMGHYERIWLASSILFYRRYVDDTFCLFDTEHDAILFFDYINDRHPNIRFAH